MKFLGARYKSRDLKPPGTLREVGSSVSEISLIKYDSDSVEKKDLSIEDLKNIVINKKSNYWLHCNSTLDPNLLESIGEKFVIHPLLLENIQNPDQKPKFNDTEDFNFIILKTLGFVDKSIERNQIAIIYFKNLIITFSKNFSFSEIEERILLSKGKVRSKGSDYLLFALLDILIDSYYHHLDILEEEVIRVEEELQESSLGFNINNFLILRKNIELVKRTILPLTPIIEGLIKSKSPPISQNNLIYFKDLINSSSQVSDIIGTISTSLEGILNLSMNISSYKMNGIMKVLTIISTIFIPLTFLAGIYGMNFTNIPELGFKWSYPILIVVMIIIAILMIRFFKKRKWF